MDYGYDTSESFERPVVFLPHNSLIPQPDEDTAEFTNRKLYPVVHQAAQATLETINQTKQSTRNRGIVETERRYIPTLATIHAQFKAICPSTDSLNVHLIPDTEVRDANIYDHYFRVTRLEMPLQFFTEQLTAIAIRAAIDLQSSTIERDEILALLNAIYQYYDGIRSDLRQAHVEAFPVITPNSSIAPTLFQDDGDGVSAESFALHRWVTGHHMFFALSIACNHRLAQVAHALDMRDEAKAQAELFRAAALLRGTTAAMWLAGNFEAEIYRGHIRQTMRDAGAQGGFSGHQSADFNRLLKAIPHVKQAAHRNYGLNLKQYPEPLYNALAHFFGTYLLDAEHHVLIAIAKVDTAAPLTHEARSSTARHQLSAAELLRALVQERSEQWLDWQTLPAEFAAQTTAN